MRLCRESERWERSFHRTGSSVVGAMWIMINVHYAPSKSCCWSLLVAIYVLSSCFAFFRAFSNAGGCSEKTYSRSNLYFLFASASAVCEKKSGPQRMTTIPLAERFLCCAIFSCLSLSDLPHIVHLDFCANIIALLTGQVPTRILGQL